MNWIENYQNDYNIFTNAKLEFQNIYNLIFDEILNKWTFTIKKRGNIAFGSKLSLDIIYNGIYSSATCYNYNDELNCFVDIQNQTNFALIKLNHIKSFETSVTWNNLLEDEIIPLTTNLTLIMADNLRLGQYWYFDLYISENIPDDSKIIIDIYYSINSIKYISQAICYYNLNNKILTFKTSINSEIALISLKFSKTNDSSSTVTWNIDYHNNDEMQMNITTSLNFSNFTKIDFIENKYIFYIFISNYLPINAQLFINIIIDNETSICRCTAISTQKISCIVNVEDYRKDSLIYISNKNNKYIKWENLPNKKLIKSIELDFLGAFDKKYNNTNLEFKILTSEINLLKGQKLSTKIIYLDSDGTNDYIPCIPNEEFLYCSGEKIKEGVFLIDLASPIDGNVEKVGLIKLIIIIIFQYLLQ